MIDSLFLLVELAALVIFLSAVRRSAKLPKTGGLGIFAYLEDAAVKTLSTVPKKKGNSHA